MTQRHFVLTQEETNYFYLVLVVIAGVFTAAMLMIAAFISVEFDTLVGLRRAKGSATLTLSSYQSSASQGQIFPVNVVLQSNLPTTGVDVAIAYDPEAVELVPQGESALTFPQKYLDTSLSVFDIFPLAELKKKEDLNILVFSAIAKPLKEFQGSGVVATLTFRALKPGSTAITLLFDRGSSSDSNVAYQGKDILVQAQNLIITIK